MTSKLDPQELERLSDALNGRLTSGLLNRVCDALDDIADKLRTGQLVPAMPSDVDLVAEAECMKQMRETAQDMGYSDVLDALEALANIKAAQPSGDVVEAVAELQLAAFLAGRGSVTGMKHGTRTAKPAPTMDQFRQMARAALGEKP